MYFNCYILISLFSFISLTNGLKLCIVGASSSLGRELIYQGINDFSYKITGITNSPSKIFVPYRGPGLEDKSNDITMIDHKLNIINYLEEVPDYDSIIFTTGGTAFEKLDYSDKVMNKFLKNLSEECKSISLVSAFGVGDSINGANLGIVAMRNWYLKDVYRAKEEQEKMLSNYNGDVKKFIYRPKVLSYGDTNFDSTTRYDLAKKMLEDIKSSNIN